MPFPGYPLTAGYTNFTDQKDVHPAAHNDAVAALNDLQAQVTAIQPGATVVDFDPVFGATTTNPNIGTTGTSDGFYIAVGQLVFFAFVVTFNGTGITSGSGTYQITLPFTPRGHTGSSAIIRSLITVRDFGVGDKHYGSSLVGTNLMNLVPVNTTSFASVTAITNATIGVTFAAGDSVSGNVLYVAA